MASCGRLCPQTTAVLNTAFPPCGWSLKSLARVNFAACQAIFVQGREKYLTHMVTYLRAGFFDTSFYALKFKYFIPFRETVLFALD